MNFEVIIMKGVFFGAYMTNISEYLYDYFFIETEQIAGTIYKIEYK